MARTKYTEKEQFAKRFLRLRKESNLTQPQLAAMVGVSKNAVGHWEKGRMVPAIETLGAICRVLGTSADELLGLKTEEVSKEEHEHMALYRQLTKYDRDNVNGLMQRTVSNYEAAFRNDCKSQFNRIEYAALPASAGTGMPLDGACEPEYVYVRVSRESCMADEVIAVNGDSMMPTYQDGDMLLVEHTCTITPGEIGVFVCAGEGYVKEYQMDGLHSHNPKYKTIHPTEDDDVRCIGRVLGAIDKTQLATAKETRVLDELYVTKPIELSTI